MAAFSQSFISAARIVATAQVGFLFLEALYESFRMRKAVQMPVVLIAKKTLNSLIKRHHFVSLKRQCNY